MVIQPDRVVAHGVVATRVEGSRWRFVSLAPWPQRAPAGDPLISLLEAGDFALLQLSVQLDPPASELEALRALLGSDRETASPVILEPAVTAVTGIRIVLEPEGDEHVLGESRGSGYPPYTAVFSLQLTGVDRDVVKRAMTGTDRLVEVVYTVDLDGTETRIVADLAAWLRAAAAPQHRIPPTGRAGIPTS